MRKLPPLNTLRAFEATARHLSAKKAAEELCVTPAAISHQIKHLENFLGLTLFARLNRQLKLTEAGQTYFYAIEKIFDTLVQETYRLVDHKNNNVTITVEPSFAMYWLLPRLEKFKLAFPEIELRILASYEILNLNIDAIDLGIRWGNGVYPGLTAELLFHNELYPVYNPILLKKKSLTYPEDILQYPLLNEKSHVNPLDYPEWDDWFLAAGLKKTNTLKVNTFETGYLLLQATLQGQGIALERKHFVSPYLKTGQLVKPFNISLKEKIGGYYIVYPSPTKNSSKIQTIISWLKQETAQE